MESMRECTFKPAIEMNRSGMEDSGCFNTTRKFEELYNLAKNVKRVDREKMEVEY